MLSVGSRRLMARTVVASPSPATTISAVGSESRVRPVAAVPRVLMSALVASRIAQAAAILRVATGKALLSRMLRWCR